jgi:alpha-tubulin suppressor-like RCC1 family protein
MPDDFRASLLAHARVAAARGGRALSETATALVFVAGLGAAVACGDGPVGGGGKELTLSADTTYIAPQEAVQLRAAIGTEPVGGTIAYRTLDAAVAGVSAAGLVTGQSVGPARIVAETAGLTDTILIRVTPSPRHALATGRLHTCVLDVEGKAYCWGTNDDGQLGNGTSVSSAAPVAVSGGRTFARVEAGDSTTCAVTPAGEGYCWGAGGAGQLGNGKTQGSAVPVQVTAPQPLASISVGYNVACALSGNGTAYCWGRNTLGNAGTGDRVMATTPRAVNTSLKFTEISVGLAQTCALTAAGTAYCWGVNFLGTVGTPAPGDQLSPAAVDGGLSFASLTAGSLATCGIAVTGGTYCWGSNYFGAVGTGSATHSVQRAPRLIASSHAFTRVGAGDENHTLTPTCLITATGQAYCMGANRVGQLGTNVTPETCFLAEAFPRFGCSGIPVPVLGGHKFETVEPGAEFVCALTHAGQVYCWGANDAFQLGTFAGTQTSDPVQVAANLRLP